MTDNVFDMLIVPQDVMHTCAKRARELRISRNITQKELAERGLAWSCKPFKQDPERPTGWDCPLRGRGTELVGQENYRK